MIHPHGLPYQAPDEAIQLCEFTTSLGTWLSLDSGDKTPYQGQHYPLRGPLALTFLAT